MNVIRGNITALLIILSYSFCRAQMAYLTPTEWVIEHEREIKNTSYILEGTVIKQKCYYMRHIGGAVMTCSLIQIRKIYKGNPQIKLGNIRVVTNGGYMENVISTPPSDGGWITLLNGGTYILLGAPGAFAPADSNMLYLMRTDNALTLNLTAEPISISKNTAQWDETKYNSLDSLYSFFKENGLTVQEEVEQK
jgi:hypothetical protein